MSSSPKLRAIPRRTHGQGDPFALVVVVKRGARSCRAVPNRALTTNRAAGDAAPYSPARARSRGRIARRPVRLADRGRWPLVLGRGGCRHRGARPERRRQDLDAGGVRGIPQRSVGLGAGVGARSPARPRPARRAARRDAAAWRRVPGHPCARGDRAVLRVLRGAGRSRRAHAVRRSRRAGPLDLASALGWRAAAAVAGARPGRRAEGGVPRRTDRLGRRRRPPARAGTDPRARRPVGAASCSARTSSRKPNGWPTGS